MKVLSMKGPLFILSGVLVFAGILSGIRFIMNTNDTPVRMYVEEVVVTPTAYIKIPQPEADTRSWNTFSDKNLKLTLQYPSHVIIDPRQTSNDRIYVFIFDEDKEKPLPGKVTALYIADTQKKGIDGFSAFRSGDCGIECEISYKNTQWININNVYGIKNPLPNDVHNYYLTDKDLSGSVVNVYVGGYMSEEKDVQDKIATFEEMIKTIRFDR